MELSSKLSAFQAIVTEEWLKKNTRNLCDDSHLQKWDSNAGKREFEEAFDVQVTVHREKFL